jgi:DnaJ-class molecular chaperone
MKKATFIDKTKHQQCWSCRGSGTDFSKEITNITRVPECPICKGTGILKRESYILVYTNKEGQKMGFQVDGLK